jgi:mannose/fructose-specific phosphotransferase system component IIA
MVTGVNNRMVVTLSKKADTMALYKTVRAEQQGVDATAVAYLKAHNNVKSIQIEPAEIL